MNADKGLRAAFIKAAGLLDNLSLLAHAVDDDRIRETDRRLQEQAKVPLETIGAVGGALGGGILGALPGSVYSLLDGKADAKKTLRRVLAGALPGAVLGGASLGLYGAQARGESIAQAEQYRQLYPWLANPAK